MSDALRGEIEREIASNPILIYGKGTKTAPRCGFTMSTIQFFERFGYPFEVVDVLENPPKRELLSQLTNWQTLPKIFINGEFLGDLDILVPMHEQGELEPLLAKTFGGVAKPTTLINLREGSPS